MKSRIHILFIGLALATTALVIGPSTLAQHSHDHKAVVDWKTGMLRLSQPVWVGKVQLKDRMYHVKHVIEDGNHMLVFKSVSLGAGYREGSMWEGKDVVRVGCRVELVAKSVSNTKVEFGKNAEGERVIQEIQIAGEKVKHVLLVDAQINVGD